jgi:hypothetical protein
MSEKLPIAPDTKLDALLEAYPELEPQLIELIPSLKSLKTPALRKIVISSTTLEQAVSGANVALPDVVFKLRRAAGLPEETETKTGPGAPPWVNAGQIVKTLDARPMMSQGQHPKEIVLQEVSALTEGQIFLLITPFVPGPLIEIARSQNCKTWTHQTESGRFETYFGK